MADKRTYKQDWRLAYRTGAESEASPYLDHLVANNLIIQYVVSQKG